MQGDPLILLLAGCYALHPENGGGRTGRIDGSRAIDEADVVVPPGFDVRAVARGLTFPTAVAFDDEGGVYVLEAGYSYGEVFTRPRILRIGVDGRPVLVVEGSNGPWNGFVWHDGGFVVAEGGEMEGGRIVRIGLDGSRRVLVEHLPSYGDHHTNGPVVGDDGYVYFGQGTATNSAFVGLDNAAFGWLERVPTFHDVPCEDVVLLGRNAVSARPERRGKVETGAFQPFGVPSEPGQVVQGDVRCNGAVLRVPLEGGEPEVVAWGLRNPFGLGFDAAGDLYVADHGYDDRGSRPVFGAPDLLYRVEDGAWYGWPDYAGERPLDDRRFAPPGGRPPGRVLQSMPGTPPAPIATFPSHGAVGGLDFARSPAFGDRHTAYVALFGDLAPGVGKVLAPVGFRVVKVDLRTGVSTDFAVNAGRTVGPASWLGEEGLERPIAARFDPTGDRLYVVDFGIVATMGDEIVPQPGTGVLWSVSSLGVAGR